MDISQLKEELLNNKLRPYYVFIGDELALQDHYIDKIKSLCNLEYVRAESIRAIYSKLFQKALIKTEPKLYVIRNDEEFYKTDSAWDKFIEAKSLKGNIVILLYSGVEKTSKFCKKHESVLTQFDYVGTSILKNRLQAITKMPDPYCVDIVKMCGNNYGRMKNELEKLRVFAVCNKLDWCTAYLEGKKQHLIHEEIGDIIFDFTNAIVERNIKKAYELYPKILQTEDGAAIKLLSVLYNTFRNVIAVQCTEFKDRTEEVLGLTKGQIYMTAQKCCKYNNFELVHIIKTLRYLEKGIKTGLVEEKFALPYLMGVIW